MQVVQCDATGLTATLTFKPNASVTGTIEQRAPAPPAKGPGGTAGSGTGLGGTGSSAAVQAAGGTRGYVKVGSFSGNWREGGIRVSIAPAGTAGMPAAAVLAARWPTVLLAPDGGSGNGAGGAGGKGGGVKPAGPLLTHITLAAPGPLQLHRLWIALYDRCGRYGVLPARRYAGSTVLWFWMLLDEGSA